MKIFIIGAVVSVLAVAPLVGAAAEKAAAGKEKVSRAFERIKGLSGEWNVVRGPADHGPHEGTITYKVTAAGSAVIETMFGGTDHEMVTVYYLDGSDLAMTHYCMLGNRPHMRADLASSPDKLVFKCRDDENAAIMAEDHMHQVTFTLVDPDHLKADWLLYKNGKSDSTHTFELVRKK